MTAGVLYYNEYIAKSLKKALTLQRASICMGIAVCKSPETITRMEPILR